MRTSTYYFAILFFAITVFGCKKEQTPTAQPENNLPTVDAQKVIKDLNLTTAVTGQFIVVPAGSTNVLQKALSDAGEGGVVYLLSGLHTETSGIKITSRAILVGETGAILKIKTISGGELDANGLSILVVGLHVMNAPKTLIQNIEIQPVESDGGTAILFENSNESASMFNTIKNFDNSILVEKSDAVAIMGNKVVGVDANLSIGINIINGKSGFVANNDVSNCVFGVWPCGQYGTYTGNNTHDNTIGLILCKVPLESIKLPSGQLTGSIISSSYYKVFNNRSDNNLSTGYLVIDGANNSNLENNTATGNTTYDYELAGDSNRFGFLTPKCFSNTVKALPNQKVKNCGLNNTVAGGVLVNTASDPCN